MKLYDCYCGGIPQVTYRIDNQSEFTISCPVCGNGTPAFARLKDAVSQWNRYFCRLNRRLTAETAE